MAVQCPRCKEMVPGLVKKYDRIDTETGKGQSIELEKPICEFCIQDVFDEIQARVKNEGK